MMRVTDSYEQGESCPDDPFTAMRALNRMRAAGFTLELDGPALVVSPADRLTEEQRQFIRAYKPALVQLLQDADVLHEALVQAGPAGLAWLEGTPADWTDARLLAADEVLYADGRMVNRAARRYLKEHAPGFDGGTCTYHESAIENPEVRTCERWEEQA